MAEKKWEKEFDSGEIQYYKAFLKQKRLCSTCSFLTKWSFICGLLCKSFVLQAVSAGSQSVL